MEEHNPILAYKEVLPKKALQRIVSFVYTVRLELSTLYKGLCSVVEGFFAMKKLGETYNDANPKFWQRALAFGP